VERGKWNFSGERKVESGEWDLYWREGFELREEREKWNFI